MFIIGVVVALANFQIVTGHDVENSLRTSDWIIQNRMLKMENQLDKMIASIAALHQQLLRLETNFETNGHNDSLMIVIETILRRQQVITKELNTLDDTSTYCCAQHQHETKPHIKPPPSITSARNCEEALGKSGHSGEYQIYVKENKDEPTFTVYCQKHISEYEEDIILDGTWLVIQRRQDGSEDFYRDWSDYKDGFGNIRREFFLGLDKIHALTKSVPHELWVQMTDDDDITAYALYNTFAIGNESDSYRLHTLGTYQGNASDSLIYSYNLKWTTKDRDNDLNPRGNCAHLRHGAWWYEECAVCNLNGEYDASETEDFGVYWYTFRKYESLKYVHMAIRPKH